MIGLERMLIGAFDGGIVFCFLTRVVSSYEELMVAAGSIDVAENVTLTNVWRDKMLSGEDRSWYGQAYLTIIRLT